MHSCAKNRIGSLKGFILVAVFAVAAQLLAKLPALAMMRISPLVVGIVLGIVFANSVRDRLPEQMDSGILFAAKQLLRLAIVFYGFRITFQEIFAVGAEGLAVSVLMVVSTLLIGIYFGTKVLKMDLETVLLTASGSAVCGAAAVLATESVMKPEEGHKAAVAVSTVVLFGSIAMFLYPAIYSIGFHGFEPEAFGIYVGGTVHEVAQVIAVGGAIGEQTANSALIVKMTRIMLIAPFLLLLGLWLSRRNGAAGKTKIKLVIPWFALGFVAMAGVNSLQFVPQDVVQHITNVDGFALTMSMAALGMETRISKLKNLGLAPIYLALTLFGWLLVGGFIITKLVVAFL